MKKLPLFSKDSAIVQSYVKHIACIIDQPFAEKDRQTTGKKKKKRKIKKRKEKISPHYQKS